MPSKLEQLQQQYRRQLLQEKEERMIKIHTDNQQKALSKVAKYNGIHSQAAMTIPKPQPTIAPPQPHHSPIKKGSPGVDRSRPLPPISKEQRNPSSTRTSPVSAPVDNATKYTVNSRSKSVDVDSRHSPSRVSQNGRINVKNGYSKPLDSEVKQPFQQVQQEKKPDQDLVAKFKQAELQRLKANTKVRDETPSLPRNGYTGAISKSSTIQKKPAAKPQVAMAAPVTPAPARPKPRTQAPAAFSSRKPAMGPKSSVRSAQGNSQSAVVRKPPGPGQEQCHICGRNFNQDRIEKHVSVCSKTSQKKTKVFDATKMRVQGTEAEQFVRKGLPKNQPKPKKSDWRKKHNDFIETIRQAKMVQQHLAKGGKVSDLPPPPPSDTSDYVPCPHCGRKFSESVAERHIPKCKNILSNKKGPVPPRRR